MLPHHFQQQDLYHEQLLHERAMALTPYAWGLSEIVVDEQALPGGLFRLVRATGVLPSGAPISIGEGEEGPAARQPDLHLPPNKSEVGVFLGVPLQREMAANLEEVTPGAPPSAGVRYLGVPFRSYDLNTGGNDQSLLAARYNVQVLFEDEDLAGYETVKIAELARGAAGTFVLREGYVPPCLRISASPYVIAGLRRLIGQLVAKQKVLRAACRERVGAGSVEFGAADVQALWMLQALNATIPVLTHAHDTGSVSPEALYLELARCAGRLLTFRVDGDPALVPPFQFTDLGTTFRKLFELIHGLVGAQLAERFIVIPLTERQAGLYVGRLADKRLLDGAAFYLAIGGDLPEATLRERIPRLLKVGSAEQIPQIISAAMPGVRVELDYRPPGAIPVRAGHIYLRLEKGGPYWEGIRSTGTISVYQPVEPSRLKIELLAVGEGG